MQAFHFDIGNSNTGPIGFCARVLAEDEAGAVRVLKAALEAIESEHAVFDDLHDDPATAPVPGLEYIRVYFNAEQITPEMIDDSEERDKDGMPLEEPTP